MVKELHRNLKKLIGKLGSLTQYSHIGYRTSNNEVFFKKEWESIMGEIAIPDRIAICPCGHKGLINNDYILRIGTTEIEQIGHTCFTKYIADKCVGYGICIACNGVSTNKMCSMCINDLKGTVYKTIGVKFTHKDTSNRIVYHEYDEVDDNLLHVHAITEIEDCIYKLSVDEVEMCYVVVLEVDRFVSLETWKRFETLNECRNYLCIYFKEKIRIEAEIKKEVEREKKRLLRINREKTDIKKKKEKSKSIKRLMDELIERSELLEKKSQVNDRRLSELRKHWKVEIMRVSKLVKINEIIVKKVEKLRLLRLKKVKEDHAAKISKFVEGENQRIAERIKRLRSGTYLNSPIIIY